MISSISPVIFCGIPICTGIARFLRAASTAPTVNAPPPVITTPEGVIPPKPLRFISRPTIVNISFKRGLMMPSIKVFFEIDRMPSGSPRSDTSISSSFSVLLFGFSSSLRTGVLGNSPKRSLIFSALSSDTRSPAARSLVMFIAPTGITDEYESAPSTKIATSVVPPPISTNTTPSSFSVSESVAAAAASPPNAIPATSTPSSDTHLCRLRIAVAPPVTRWVSTSSRTPPIPMGSTMPS